MTKDRYLPSYSPGEILVCFKRNLNVGQEFAQVFGEGIGYTLVSVWEIGDDVFVYRTEAGKEEKACSDFKEQGQFVDWAGRRDAGLEKRWESLDDAIAALEELRDDCEIPEREYGRRIDEIKKKL
ncbi:hypothetical protein HYT55_03700 [Candidatus Woesearchaeota archaeon]|nr:hypothetical protein [Candidatus Woesearchaeota archaeon]